jgi:ADP-ribosyl-[dinitrogen reductase] hydrolase
MKIKNARIKDRYRGCLIGLAVGDALGAPFESMSPGDFPPVLDTEGSDPFDLNAGMWTDDTSMALCLAESLIRCRGFDPNDQMQRYVKWRNEGYLSSMGYCFGIGNTVNRALDLFECNGQPYCGLTDRLTAGNGSLMRLAPVPMFFRTNPLVAIDCCAKSSRTTHATPMAVDACRYFGGLLVGALNGRPKDTILSPLFHPVAGRWINGELSPEIESVATGSFRQKEPPVIRGTGFVVESLEAALWAFNKSTNFAHGALLAVNLGDDTDTTGAIYGQLAGACYGLSNIPESWRKLIISSDMILDFADQLYRARTKQT